MIAEVDIDSVLQDDFSLSIGDQVVMGGLPGVVEDVAADVITVQTVEDRPRPKTSFGHLQFVRRHKVRRPTLAVENT